MQETTNKRLVLTSVNQLLVLLQKNPEIANSVPRLHVLIGRSLSTEPKKSCNCAGRRNIQTHDENKQLAEQVLSSLTNEDFKKIRDALGFTQLCYYRRDLTNNSLQLFCV